jgi:hypothetical protein
MEETTTILFVSYVTGSGRTVRMEEFLRDASGHELTLPVDHLSATQISMLNRCPEQYRQRYVLGKKERPGAALIVGGAFHEAIEDDFAGRSERRAARRVVCRSGLPPSVRQPHRRARVA